MKLKTIPVFCGLTALFILTIWVFLGTWKPCALDPGRASSSPCGASGCEKACDTNAKMAISDTSWEEFLQNSSTTLASAYGNSFSSSNQQEELKYLLELTTLWDSLDRIYISNAMVAPTLEELSHKAEMFAIRFQLEMTIFLNRTSEYPENIFFGMGIVIVAGGKYFPPAYTVIRMLRRVNCTLPIEVWHTSSERPTPIFAEKISQRYHVQFRNFDDIAPAVFGGFGLKIGALLFTRFEQVIFLDADNIVLSDPAFLLRTPEYLNTGLLMWPDLWYYEPFELSSFWKLVGKSELARYAMPAHETGQLVMNKKRMWPALMLALLWTHQHKLWFSVTVPNGAGVGDKELLPLACKVLDIPYSTIRFPPAVAGVYDQTASRVQLPPEAQFMETHTSHAVPKRFSQSGGTKPASKIIPAKAGVASARTYQSDSTLGSGYPAANKKSAAASAYNSNSVASGGTTGSSLPLRGIEASTASTKADARNTRVPSSDIRVLDTHYKDKDTVDTDSIDQNDRNGDDFSLEDQYTYYRFEITRIRRRAWSSKAQVAEVALFDGKHIRLPTIGTAEVKRIFVPTVPSSSSSGTAAGTEGSKSSDSAPAEDPTLALDGHPETNWVTERFPPAMMIVQFAAPREVSRYSLYTSADDPYSDPVSWELAGSQDGYHWISLHAVCNFPTPFKRSVEVGPFSIDDANSYPCSTAASTTSSHRAAATANVGDNLADAGDLSDATAALEPPKAVASATTGPSGIDDRMLIGHTQIQHSPNGKLLFLHENCHKISFSWALSENTIRWWQWIAWHDSTTTSLTSPRAIILPDEKVDLGRRVECRFQLTRPDFVKPFLSVIPFDVESVIRSYLRELILDEDFEWDRRIRKIRFHEDFT